MHASPGIHNLSRKEQQHGTCVKLIKQPLVAGNGLTRRGWSDDKSSKAGGGGPVERGDAHGEVGWGSEAQFWRMLLEPPEMPALCQACS